MTELPVIGKKDIRGESVTVRAVPYGLAEKLAKANSDNVEAMQVSREIVQKCCTLENGEPLDCDVITVKECLDLVSMASDPEADADFPQPSED